MFSDTLTWLLNGGNHISEDLNLQNFLGEDVASPPTGDFGGLYFESPSLKSCMFPRKVLIKLRNTSAMF